MVMMKRPEPAKKTVHYYGVTTGAQLLGITKVSFVQRHPQPVPDVMIGKTRGWTAESLLAWDKATPPAGRRPASWEDDHDATHPGA